MSHLKTIFSQRANKAWIAGLATFAAPYLVEWLNSLTADKVAGFFASNGVEISQAGVAFVVGVAGLVATYAARNRG